MSEPKYSLSLSIISKNEEVNLRRCLESAADLVSEIVVVDSGSTDGTLAVAAEYEAAVHHQEWLRYRDQKNVALKRCTQPWVLAMDCDEELSDELKASIRRFFDEGQSERYVAAMMARKVWFLGRWIKHGDWYPDRKIRLFLREKATWGGSPEHDRVELEGAVKLLDGDLHHFSFRDMAHYVSKINGFADVFLDRQRETGKRWSLTATVTRPLWRIFRAYVLRRGFLDGFPGLWIAVSTGYFAFVRYSRKYEDEQGEAGA